MTDSTIGSGRANLNQLAIQWEEGPSTCTIRIGGRLLLGEGRGKLESLASQASASRKGLIVNMERLESVDSSGIGLLVRIAASLGDRVRFVGVERSLKPLAAVCKLLVVLPSCQDETAALAALEGVVV